MTFSVLLIFCVFTLRAGTVLGDSQILLIVMGPRLITRDRKSFGEINPQWYFIPPSNCNFGVIVDPVVVKCLVHRTWCARSLLVGNLREKLHSAYHPVRCRIQESRNFDNESIVFVIQGSSTSRVVAETFLLSHSC